MVKGFKAGATGQQISSSFGLNNMEIPDSFTNGAPPKVLSSLKIGLPFVKINLG